MAITLTGSVTGSAVTGLTSPVFSLVADTAPESNGKQGAVTTLGGTQSDVMEHSLSVPYTMMYARPRAFNSQENRIGNKVQMNKHTFLTRKGVNCVTSTLVPVHKTAIVRTGFEIPVGSETHDLVSIKSMISAHAGWLNTHLDEVATAISTGTI